MIELFDCERLLARISAATCEANRKRSGFQQIFACQGCPGLGQKSVEITEIEVMAKPGKAGKCVVCKRSGLVLNGRGECGRCVYRSRNGKDPVTNMLIKVSTGPAAEEPDALPETKGHYGHEDGCDCAVCEDVNHCSPKEPVAGVPASLGKVVNAEGLSVPFGVDGLVLQAIRESWAEAEARLLPQLSGLKPSAALVRAAKIVEQLEGIGC